MIKKNRIAFIITLFISLSLGSLTQAQTDNLEARQDNPDNTVTFELIAPQESFAPAVSDDGRYIAFASYATDLVSDDTNGVADVFVHDRQTGETSRVSIATDGTQGNGASENPRISADGRHVVFVSEADNLVARDSNGRPDIFVHDRQMGETERVSIASDGTETNRSSWQPDISADGRFVAFHSGANTLVPGDTQQCTVTIEANCDDVFVYDRQSDTIERVSLAQDGSQGNGHAGGAALSADGRYVAFYSRADNLVAGDSNGAGDIFVYDRQTDSLEHVSVASDGTKSNFGSSHAVISADGRYVAFQSLADNLVAQDVNAADDVFLHDRQTGQTELISLSSDGTPGDKQSGGNFDEPRALSISADGRYVAYSSIAENLVEGDANNQRDVFIRDRLTSQTVRVSETATGTGGDAVSDSPVLTADGLNVVFRSNADNLGEDEFSSGKIIMAAISMPDEDEAAQLFIPMLMKPDTSPPDDGDNELTPEERIAAIKSIESRLNDSMPSGDTPLAQRDLQAEVQQIATELLTLPEVIATTFYTETLTAHAILSDGLSITIINNRPSGLDDVAGRSALNNAIDSAASETNAPDILEPVADTPSLPGSHRAVVANFDGGNQVASEVRSMLSEAGYDVLALDAGLADMRNYTNLGALYLDTHGGNFWSVTELFTKTDGTVNIRPEEMHYALQSATRVDLVKLLDKQTKDDIDNGRVVISVSKVLGNWHAKLAITEKFINHYWSFDNAIVMIHSCYGGSDSQTLFGNCNGACDADAATDFDPTRLHQAMHNQGANLVVGFDNVTATGIARESILFFWDRMSAANEEQSLTPPPRPFPWQEVRRDMEQRGLLRFEIQTGGSGLFGKLVKLKFIASAEVAGLAPSIKNVDVLDDAAQPQGELTLHGHFGAPEGIVTLDGRTTTITDWTPEQIVVQTPFAGNGAAGDLIVKSPDEVQSNPVPITEWRGEVTITRDDSVANNELSLLVKTEIDLRFRADLHPYRESLDSNLQERTVTVYISPGSTGRTIGSGQSADGSASFSGDTPMQVFDKQTVDRLAQGQGELPAPNQFGGIITLNPKTGAVDLCMSSVGSYTQTTQIGSPLEKSSIVEFGLALSLVAESGEGFLGCFDLSMDENYVIAGGQKSTDSGLYKLEWTDFEPVSPPTDQTPG